MESTQKNIFSFDVPFNESLVHQVVLACLANQRSLRTKKQKTRAEVRGGGRKPWRQKGTGNARAGTIRSPLWRGGGKVFAATPLVLKQKTNKKMYSGAMRSILCELSRQNRIIQIDKLEISSHKTKFFLQEMSRLLNLPEINEKLLILTEEFDKNLLLSSRNLPLVQVCQPQMLNPVNLIGASRILMTKAAQTMLEESFK